MHYASVHIFRHFQDFQRLASHIFVRMLDASLHMSKIKIPVKESLPQVFIGLVYPRHFTKSDIIGRIETIYSCRLKFAFSGWIFFLGTNQKAEKGRQIFVPEDCLFTAWLQALTSETERQEIQKLSKVTCERTNILFFSDVRKKLCCCYLCLVLFSRLWNSLLWLEKKRKKCHFRLMPQGSLETDIKF